MNGNPRTSFSNGADEFADLTRVTVFFGIAVATALSITIWYAVMFNGLKFGGVVLWALAAFSAGAGLGFLFGIPKVLQQERPPAQSQVPAAGASGSAPSGGSGTSQSLAYRQRVNTNLEEISDWLTKIIVGVSLIQLNSGPDYLRRIGDLIGASIIDSTPHRGFGVSLVLFYTTAGFLYGYLATRLYIQGALARAERGIEQDSQRAEQELRTQLGRTDQQTEEALEKTAAAPAGMDREAPTGEIDDHLRALANEYLNVRISDYGERVRDKNRRAAEMGAYVIKRGIDRNKLAEETNEGLLLALAAAVQGAAELADTNRLIRAAHRVSRLHVQYRFLLAFARLLDLGYVSDEQRAAIRTILDLFETRADDSLRQAIIGLRRKLG